MENTKPDWIVNPAAYTGVDKAESEPALAHAINVETPRALGDAAAELGVPVIHFSTDYVFDGTGDRPWREDDATGPLGAYGASKLAGEVALRESGAAHLIFRTSWVYGSRGKNFLLTILNLAQHKEELRIVNDQHGAPTWSRNLAQMVIHAMKRISRDGASLGRTNAEVTRSLPDVYHAAGSGETTWFGFADEFLRVAALARPEIRWARLTPIASSDYPMPARRPTNSRLNCDRLRETFGFELPQWRDATAAVIAEVLG